MQLDKATTDWLKKSLNVKTLEGVTINDPKTGKLYTHRKGDWVENVTVVGTPIAAVGAEPLRGPRHGQPSTEPINASEHLKHIQKSNTNPRVIFRLMKYDEQVGTNVEVARSDTIDVKPGNKITMKNVVVPQPKVIPVEVPQDYRQLDDAIREA